jgi:type II secretory pathway pseudopilin PulG
MSAPFAASLSEERFMTLTESCVAAAVVSTVMAVALPPLNRARQTYVLSSAAHDVAGRMHFARISAINRNRDCRLSVTSAVSYVIECDEGSWRVIARLAMPQGITLSANARPEFHRRGNVSPAATFTLRNMAGTLRRVIVNVNGRVRIQ